MKHISMKCIKQNLFILVLSVTASCIGLMTTAAIRAEGTQADVTFHGTLIEAPPCVLNGGEPVVVDFGNEVMTTRIDGEEYKMPVAFTLDCSGASSSKQRLRISGAPADFDPQAIAGGMQPGFAIALYDGEQRYTPGKWLPFTDPAVPKLYAVPVKKNGVTLTGGAFSVMASLVVDYQ